MFKNLFKKVQDLVEDNQPKNQPEKRGYDEEEGVYYAKGSFDNAIEYNNELMCVANKCEDNMADMNAAMDAKDYARAEKVRLQWKEDLEDYIAEVKQLGAYNGNDSLLKATIRFFEFYKGLMDEGYKVLIEMRAAGKRGTPEEQAQLKKNNDAIIKNSGEFNGESDDFLENYDENGEEYDTSFENPYMNMAHDDSNPMLQPIHGVSLQDYAAAASKMANGMSADEVCKRLGIDMPIWDEANQLWVKRMQQDQTMAVMSLYGQYYGSADTHPKFNDSVKESNQEGDYLSKIQNDEAFYYELCGARQAAYEAGLDGAQWIQDNYGISLGDFQSVAMKWMANMGNIEKMLRYQEQKQREYAEKFSKEMGGGVADDIEF